MGLKSEVVGRVEMELGMAGGADLDSGMAE